MPKIYILKCTYFLVKYKENGSSAPNDNHRDLTFNRKVHANWAFQGGLRRDDKGWSYQVLIKACIARKYRGLWITHNT